MCYFVYIVVTRGAIAVRRKSCLICIDFHPCIAGAISRYCMCCSEGKREIERFLGSLVARGYTHFVLYIEKPSDVWIAELVRDMKIASREDLIYSIGVWQYEEDPCNWMEELPFDWDAITKSAFQVFSRSKDWYDTRYRVERLYVSIGEKWYDGCDRSIAGMV